MPNKPPPSSKRRGGSQTSKRILNPKGRRTSKRKYIRTAKKRRRKEQAQNPTPPIESVRSIFKREVEAAVISAREMASRERIEIPNTVVISVEETIPYQSRIREWIDLDGSSCLIEGLQCDIKANSFGSLPSENDEQPSNFVAKYTVSLPSELSLDSSRWGIKTRKKSP
ncbi:MAG: hypothetical protein ABIH52_00375 [Candidatus Aenigmatarchaeota archaeon]|nr:hypothetical protein [Nanoarchaeota archaeon]